MRLQITIIALAIALLGGSAAFAWTGPTATAPGNNVSAPINTSATGQTKAGNLGITGYLNFGPTLGTTGYGIRDNAGLLEFKNSGGAWASLQATIFNLGGGATVSGTTNNLAKFTSGSAVGNSSISEPSSGTLKGFSGGVGVGAVTTGWYSDSTNLAARAPSTSGGTYFQDNNGGRTWAIIGANVGGIYDDGSLNVTGDVYASDVYSSASGKWLSQAARYNGAQFYSGTISGNMVVCPSGSVMVGTMNDSWVYNHQNLCQWIN